MKLLCSIAKKAMLDRPLGCSCGALMVFTALLLFAPLVVKISLFIASAIAIPLLLFFRKKMGKGKTVVTLIAVLLLLSSLAGASCLWNYDLFDKKAEALAQNEEHTELRGYAERVIYESELSCCYQLRLTHIDGQRVFGVKILALFSPEDPPPLFRIFSAKGSLSLPQNTDPSFDGASYYRTKGIFAQFTPEELSVTKKRPFTIDYPLHLMREWVNDLAEDALTERSAPLVKALLLGDKSALSDEFKRDFKTLGLSHLLAVSGLHLSVLFGMWSFLLLKMRIPLKARCLILIPLIFLFCALCSFSLSVMRAAVMLLMVLLSKLVDEENDSLTALLFAGGLIVFFSPFSLFDVGFLLSFFATFGILQVQPLLIRKKLKEKGIRRVGRTVFNALAVSFAAQIAVLPVAYLSFGSISLFSPLATLLFAPLVSLLLYLAPFTLICSFVPGISTLLRFLTDRLCALIEWGAQFARFLKEGLVSTGHPITLILLIILIVLSLLFLICTHKKRFALLLLAGYLLFGSLCTILPRFDAPRCLAEVNGKNDVMVFYDGGRSLLVDLSDGSKKNLRLSLQMLLEETGDLNPDALLLTHYHQRHISALEELCAQYYLERLYLSDPIDQREEELFERLCILAEGNGVKVTVLKEDELIKMGQIGVSDLKRAYLKRSTHPILSLKAEVGQDSFTYLSASAPELFSENCESRVYLGVHGPVIKKPLSEPFRQNRLLLFASSETAKKYGCPFGQVQDGSSRSLLFK